MRGAAEGHFSWQGQYLVNLDDAFKASKRSFCQMVAIFGFCAWSGRVAGAILRMPQAHFLGGRNTLETSAKSGWNRGNTSSFTFSFVARTVHGEI